MEIRSVTAFVVTAGVIGWGARQLAPSRPTDEAAPGPPLPDRGTAPRSTGPPTLGSSIASFNDTDPAETSDAPQLRKQLEAARISAYNARHALDAARADVTQLKATLTGVHVQFDEEIARARLADRMHAASRRSREEAIEQRVALEEAVQRERARAHGLEQRVQELTRTTATELALLRDAHAALQSDRDALAAEVAALKAERVAQQPAAPPPQTAVLIQQVHHLHHQLAEVAAQREAMMADLSAALSEVDTLKRRLYRTPPAR